jgi:hypothetical protein
MVKNNFVYILLFILSLNTISFSINKDHNKKILDFQQTLARAFINKDEKIFSKSILPSSVLEKVFTPDIISKSGEGFYSKITGFNQIRFKEWTEVLGNLKKHQWESEFVLGNKLSNTTVYSNNCLVYKNSYIILKYSNRITIKIKIEELVLIQGEYFIIKLD